MDERTKWLLGRLADCRKSPFLLISYLLLGSTGVLVFVVSPIQSIADRGGHLITIIWGTFCLVAATAGLVGMILAKQWLQVLGTALAATASLTWCAALVLQAIHTESAAPLTAACMAATLAAKFAHRSAEVFGREPQ